MGYYHIPDCVFLAVWFITDFMYRKKNINTFSPYNLVSRRLFLLGSLSMSALVFLLWPLYRLQIRQKKKYMLLSESNRLTLRPLLPIRGKILDRFGEDLATNVETSRLVVTVRCFRECLSLWRRLSSLVTLPPLDKEGLKKGI